MKIVKKINSHISAMERRLQYLEDRLENTDSPNSFDVTEARAVRVSIRCMKMVRLLRTADPVQALKDLVEATKHGDDDDIVVAVAKAETSIKLADDIEEEDL